MMHCSSSEVSLLLAALCYVIYVGGSELVLHSYVLVWISVVVGREH